MIKNGFPPAQPVAQADGQRRVCSLVFAIIRGAVVRRLARTLGLQKFMSTLHFPIPVKAEGRFIKQSGPIGRFGHVVIVVEQVVSLNIEFSWQVPESSIPSMFQAAVSRGVCRLFEPEAKLAEFNPNNLLVRVVGGTFHPTDSNEISYEIASANAFINAVAANAAA